MPKPQLGWLVPIATVAISLILYWNNPLQLQALRNSVFDQYQRWDARPYQDAPVRIIDIDDESLSRIGQWPWPRTRVAELVSRLQSAGAGAIAFDVIFAEPDRTSPASMLRTWKMVPGLEQTLSRLPDHDGTLAGTMAKGKVIVGHALQREGALTPHFARPYTLSMEGPSALPFLHGYGSSVTAMPIFQYAAAGNGALSFVPDADGVVRRVPLFLGMRDEAVPSLVAEAIRVSQGEKDYTVVTSREKDAGIEAVRIGGLTIPTTREGEIWVHYTRDDRTRYIPAWKVLSGKVPDELLLGQILLIGSSAQGLMDLRFSPMGEVIPGVEVHAQALEQIIVGEPLERPNWAFGLEVCIIFIAGLLVGFIALQAGAIVSALVMCLFLAMTTWGGWHLFSQHRLLLDPVTPGITVFMSFVLSSLHHHISSERRQRWLKQAFTRYVSPNRVSHMLENPDALQLGGDRRECSFIFTDLAGFTSLMEKLDPTVAVSLLNGYLDKMVRIAFKYEGTLDRIVGDAVAIMFSAPVKQDDHRQRALDCAAEMHVFATRYAEEARSRGVPFGVTRIGIHTGEVTVGNFGGETMFDYRALGDPVNTAARLESVNKQLGTVVCVSAATLSGAPDTPARPVGKLVLKGKTEPLMVYEPLFAARTDIPSPDPEYEQAYNRMASGDTAARNDFERLAASRPADPLVNFHLKRLADGQIGDVIVFDEK